MESAPKKRGRPKKIVNKAEVVQNGFSEAIMGFNPGSVGTQLDQVDTVFKNNRWYLISNMRQVLSEVYAEHGLIQVVVDVPVDDGLRNGVEVKTKQLSEDELHLLMAEMERNDDINVVGQTMKWNRLYGGAGIVVMTDQDPETPLDMDAIGPDTPLEFRATDMWELFWDKMNTEAYDPSLQEHKFTHYSYYGTKLHKSRVMRMKGITPPSFIRPRLRGWGLSVVEPLVRSINQYFKTNELCFEVLDEFKLDIFKIKNLTTTLLSSTGTAQVQHRVALANQQKNFQNAITMDSEDDYVQKQLSFSGLAEILEQIRIQIASDLRMPITKIFGISPSGWNSGESEMENYNSMIESQIRAKCKYDILKVVQLRCQKLFGFIPDDLQIQFQPLRMLNAEQQENVKTQKFNRLISARQGGEIDSQEFRNAVNRDDLLPNKLEARTIPDVVRYEEDVASEGHGEQPETDKTYSRSPSIESEDRAHRRSLQNYFTEADNIKIPFKKEYHPRDKDGVFRKAGKTSEEVRERQQYSRRKEKLAEGGPLHIVLWRKTDEGHKAILVEKVSPQARDKIKEHFEGTAFHVESYSDKPPVKVGEIQKKKNDIMPEDAETVLEDLTEASIQNPGDVDEQAWEEAKKACVKQYGKVKYAVVMAIYKKMKGIE